jgi:hypothetical protein
VEQGPLPLPLGRLEAGAQQDEAAGELTAEVGERLELVLERERVISLTASGIRLEDLLDRELGIPAKAIEASRTWRRVSSGARRMSHAWRSRSSS